MDLPHKFAGFILAKAMQLPHKISGSLNGGFFTPRSGRIRLEPLLQGRKTARRRRPHRGLQTRCERLAMGVLAKGTRGKSKKTLVSETNSWIPVKIKGKPEFLYLLDCYPKGKLTIFAWHGCSNANIKPMGACACKPGAQAMPAAPAELAPQEATGSFAA